MRRLTSILLFLKLTRPLFLMGGFSLYALGALAAVAGGAALRWDRFLLGQIIVTSIQLMTHYTNEYFDREGDLLNDSRTWFSGGSGVLSSGALPPVMALRAAAAITLVGMAALLLAGLQVPVVSFYGVIALVGAWSYSGPPFRLVSTGFGELSASLVVAAMVPIVGYTMQTGGPLSPILLAILIPLCLLHFSMLVAFQIPDWRADQAAGKRTLAVRLGLERAVRLHNIAILLAFCAILGLVILRWPGARLAWLGLPLAVWQLITIEGIIRRARQDRAVRFGGLTARALALFAFTTILWIAGFAISGIKI